MFVFMLLFITFRQTKKSNNSRKSLKSYVSRLNRPEHFVIEVQQINAFRAARDGGVHPAEVLLVRAVVGQVALVDEHVLPLAALRLVASQRVGELHLYGVQERIFLDFEEPRPRIQYLHIILSHSLIQFLVCLVRKRRAVTVQAFEDDFHIHVGMLGVIAKPHGNVRKMEAVEFLLLVNGHDLHNVAIG